MKVDHAFQCKKGGLITIFHSNVSDEWGTLCSSALAALDVTHEPLLKYGRWRTVMVETAAEPEE